MSRKPGDTIAKDPSSDEPQGFDWTDYLDELGTAVAITTSSWSSTPSGLSLHDPSASGGFTHVFLAGGVSGKKYTVTNQIVTNSSPPVTDDRSFCVLVKER